ncbi:MAG: hypothetical protein IPJ34_18555 [Myxococcales bacterium]|nr:hypothetical protein [Myxococcales bacterium]
MQIVCDWPQLAVQRRRAQLPATNGVNTWGLPRASWRYHHVSMPRNAGATSFPLSLGWVFIETVLVPMVVPVVALGILASLAGKVPEVVLNVVAIALAAGFVLVLVVRLPLFVYTAFFDSAIVLGETALRVPNVGVFQLRAWDLPFAQLDSVTHARKGGSTTRIVLTLSGGGVRTFPATFVSDRYEVIEAIERRIADGHRDRSLSSRVRSSHFEGSRGRIPLRPRVRRSRTDGDSERVVSASRRRHSRLRPVSTALPGRSSTKNAAPSARATPVTQPVVVANGPNATTRERSAS